MPRSDQLVRGFLAQTSRLASSSCHRIVQQTLECKIDLCRIHLIAPGALGPIGR